MCLFGTPPMVICTDIFCKFIHLQCKSIFHIFSIGVTQAFAGPCTNKSVSDRCITLENVRTNKYMICIKCSKSSIYPNATINHYLVLGLECGAVHHSHIGDFIKFWAITHEFTFFHSHTYPLPGTLASVIYGPIKNAQTTQTVKKALMWNLITH